MSRLDEDPVVAQAKFDALSNDELIDEICNLDLGSGKSFDEHKLMYSCIVPEEFNS